MKRDKLRGTPWKNEAGPRKSKTVVDKLAELNNERYSRIERWDSGDSTVRVFHIGGNQPASNQAAVREWNAIGEAFHWTITNDTLTQIEAAIDAAMPRAIAARPIKDYRKSAEVPNA